MELREWLIILGLALVTLIVVDGVRRLQRQRRIPRLDEVADDAQGTDPEEAARAAEINWELPNGGARVVRPADYSRVQSKPKLERREHPGPSRVLASWKEAERDEAVSPQAGAPRPSRDEPARPAPEPAEAQARTAPEPEPARAYARDDNKVAAGETREAAAETVAEGRREPSLSALADDEVPASDASRAHEPLAADPEDHDDGDEVERYRLVDLDGVGDSLKSGSKRVGASVQRFGASLQKTLGERREHKRLEKARRDREKAERAAREAEQQRLAREQAEAEKAAREAERRRLEAEAIAAADDDDPLFAPPQARQPDEEPAERPEPLAEMSESEAASLEASLQSDKVRAHPVLEKALRHDVSAEHARLTLSQAEEIIVISVMSRDEAGFSGTALLDLMLACGLRYDRDMGVFHRFETEDPESRLQFSMVNVVKPGIFPIAAMDDFQTPGITLLMPLPGAEDCSAAFEAMVETAMVVVRHLGGELKDENHSVMTAQTVEFARQRVQEFVRRNRLHRYQVN
ncbi:cell division protein ZipA [Halomonas ramblicola]|uniref:cell division protein ZipA n=1 Tax=Halomonas ramblicola TaxID=747349 RepID=UPI0025B506C8|nr:cell division protein ZipA [Halomonas ramblicola]MDN3521432.1 cell division protein ZipA [Halomonas ramblicola]